MEDDDYALQRLAGADGDIGIDNGSVVVKASAALTARTARTRDQIERPPT
jgi:hypothetical protein